MKQHNGRKELGATGQQYKRNLKKLHNGINDGRCTPQLLRLLLAPSLLFPISNLYHHSSIITLQTPTTTNTLRRFWTHHNADTITTSGNIPTRNLTSSDYSYRYATSWVADQNPKPLRKHNQSTNSLCLFYLEKWFTEWVGRFFFTFNSVAVDR